MQIENKYSLYIGLLKSDMKTKLNKESVLKLVAEKLISIGIIGFNAESINGFWSGESEKSLKVSFINTFNVNQKDIIKVLNNLKISLEQESILIEKEKVLYNLI